MDFDEYVAARRATLARAAVLLGFGEAAAPKAADGVLRDSARRIRRVDDPDPLVFATLARTPLPHPAAPPPAAGGQDRGHRRASWTRRVLADLDEQQRQVAVLSHFADLAPQETADALGLTRAEVDHLEHDARAALEVDDDTAARDLLLAAGEAVALPWLPPLEPPSRRRRRPLVLAAAAAIAGLTLAAVAMTSAPSDDGVLTEDQVPSLFGYDVTSARLLLIGRGLEVTERRAPACDPLGLVVGTDPPTGVEVDEGDTVALLTASPADYSCLTKYADRSDAWDFLAFAAGRADAPRFADRVAVVVDGSAPVSLTRTEAADPDRWGDPSVLTAITEALAEVVDLPGSPVYRTPDLSAVRLTPPAARCGVPRPVDLRGREALSLVITLRGQSNDCSLTVDLYRRGETIDAVVLYTGA
jgi:hypothetical protein